MSGIMELYLVLEHILYYILYRVLSIHIGSNNMISHVSFQAQ